LPSKLTALLYAYDVDVANLNYY